MTKKVSIYALFLCWLALSFVPVAYASNEESSVQEIMVSDDDAYEYCILEDGSAEITKYLGKC